MNRYAFCCLTILCVPCFSADVLRSPDGKIEARVFVAKDGALHYDIRWKDRTIIEASRLGITVDWVDLSEQVTIGKAERTSRDEIYVTRGVHTQDRNHYTQWTFPITHRPSGRKWSLACRVFDDGVALRYLVFANGTQYVDGENSSWKIIKDAKAWYFERTAKKWKLKSYAGEWLTTEA